MKILKILKTERMNQKLQLNTKYYPGISGQVRSSSPLYHPFCDSLGQDPKPSKHETTVVLLIKEKQFLTKILLLCNIFSCVILLHNLMNSYRIEPKKIIIFHFIFPKG